MLGQCAELAARRQVDQKFPVTSQVPATVESMQPVRGLFQLACVLAGAKCIAKWLPSIPFILRQLFCA